MATAIITMLYEGVLERNTIPGSRMYGHLILSLSTYIRKSNNLCVLCTYVVRCLALVAPMANVPSYPCRLLLP